MTTTPQHEVADAIRAVTTPAQTAYDEGYRAGQIDLHDLTELLLSIADRLDPPVSGKQPGCALCQEPDEEEVHLPVLRAGVAPEVAKARPKGSLRRRTRIEPMIPEPRWRHERAAGERG